MMNKQNIPRHIDEGDVFVQLSKHWHEDYDKKNTPAHHIDEGDVFVQESEHWHENYKKIPHHMTEEEVILEMTKSTHH